MPRRVLLPLRSWERGRHGIFQCKHGGLHPLWGLDLAVGVGHLLWGDWLNVGRVKSVEARGKVKRQLSIDRMGLDGGKRSRVCRGPLVELSNG